MASKKAKKEKKAEVEAAKKVKKAVSVEEPEKEGAEESEKELDPVEKLEKELAEEKDKLLRLRAEYDNYRKRTFKDIGNARITGQVETVIPILQVFDHFNMAMISVERADNIEAISQGMAMIQNEFKKAIDELGIEPVDAVGKKFDPKLHDAVGSEASDEVEEDIVIKQWSCGYKMGERILRAARVIVSRGSVKEEKAEEE